MEVLSLAGFLFLSMEPVTGDIVLVSDWGTDTIFLVDTRHPQAPTEVFADGLDDPYGLFVEGSTLYWVDSGLGGRVRRASLVDEAPENLVGGRVYPLYLTVHDEHIYWSEGQRVGDGSIWRCKSDGSEFVQLPTEVSWPRGLVVTDGHLYWTDAGDDTLSRASLADLQGTKEVLLRDLGGPRGLVFHEGWLFWCEATGNRLRKYSLEEERIEEVLSEGVSNPRGIAVSPGWIYWANLDTGAVMRVDHHGGNVQTLLSDLDQPRGLAVIPNSPITPREGLPVPIDIRIQYGRLGGAQLELKWETDSDHDYQIYWSSDSVFWRRGVYKGSLFDPSLTNRSHLDRIPGNGASVAIQPSMKLRFSRQGYFLVRRFPKES